MSLSTSSVYPGSTASGFEAASRLGFDGVEVMVSIDEVSGDVDAVRALSDFHEIPVVSVHAPCLLVTQHVWGTEPWGKLHRSAEMALELGAGVVVVHPPFRWQREYARAFVDGIADLETQYDLSFAVENMYPWRTGRREFQAYAPGWDPRARDVLPRHRRRVAQRNGRRRCTCHGARSRLATDAHPPDRWLWLEE